MGGGSSSSYEQTVNSVSDIMFGSFSKQSTSQSAMIENDMDINIEGSTVSGVKFTNTATLDMKQVATKVASAANSSKVTQEIMQKLKESTSAGMPDLKFGDEDNKKIVTNIKNKVQSTFEQIQEDVNNSKITNKMKINIVDSSVTDSEFSNDAKAEMSQISEAAAEIVNSVINDQKGTQDVDIEKTNFLVDGITAIGDGVSSVIGSFMNPMAFIWVFVFICIAAVFIFAPVENLDSVGSNINEGIKNAK